MKLRLISLATALLLLAGCASTPKVDEASVVDANAGGLQGDGVATQGLGPAGGVYNEAANCTGAPGKAHYYFDFDSYEVRPESLQSVSVQANYLVQNSGDKVLVTGNTDDRGSSAYNLALGQRRADAVKRALQKDGVKASQIATVSYGAERPIATGRTEGDYQCNRRSDVIYK